MIQPSTLPHRQVLLLRRAPHRFAPVGDAAQGKEYGTSIGTAVGTYYGNPALGAQVGSVAGGVIGSLTAGKDPDCGDAQNHWPDVPFQPAEILAMPKPVGDAIIKNVGDFIDKVSHPTGNDYLDSAAGEIIAKFDLCYPNVGSLKEAMVAETWRKTLATIKTQRNPPAKGSLALPLALGAGAVGLGVWAWKAGLFR